MKLYLRDWFFGSVIVSMTLASSLTYSQMARAREKANAEIQRLNDIVDTYRTRDSVLQDLTAKMKAEINWLTKIKVEYEDYKQHRVQSPRVADLRVELGVMEMKYSRARDMLEPVKKRNEELREQNERLEYNLTLTKDIAEENKRLRTELAALKADKEKVGQ